MAKKERDRRPVGHRPPPCVMAPGANFKPGWVICRVTVCVVLACWLAVDAPEERAHSLGPQLD